MSRTIKEKKDHSKIKKIISTVVYLGLIAALVFIRFPVSISAVSIPLTDENAAVSDQLDAHENPVLPEYSILYDRGKGYTYEGKANGKPAEITNTIRGVKAGSNILYTVYQDGDPSLIIKLNSLDVGMEKLRFNLPNRPVAIQQIDFLDGDKIRRTITAQEIVEHFTPSADIASIELSDGAAVVTPSSEDSYLEVDTSMNSFYYQRFHAFGVVNIALMLIFTAIYLVIGHGHSMMNKLQEKLLK